MSNATMSISQGVPGDKGSADGAQTGVVYLDAGLEVQHVEAAFDRLSALSATSEAVIVDISRVAIVDTAGMQLLLALRAESQKPGAKISIRGDSSAVTDALSLLGLQDFTASAARHAV